MEPRARLLVIRSAIFVCTIVVIGYLFVFGRNIGLGEASIIFAVFSLIFIVESIRYVIRKFLAGLRGG